MSRFRIGHPIALLAAPVFLAVCAFPAPAHGVSEKDYFSDLPEVLSVSRLAQPLDEVPGAVTVIDGETIRRLAVRNVAEVLRLVPGFSFTRRNGGNPLVQYHAALDEYGSRMQVYVDGRSVYSPFYLGDTHRGLLGVVLEDIERIEVLRGSNSAAFGGNAFLGVVNIITRHSADTLGGNVSVTRGERGISDQSARLGWGNETASFRLTAASQADHGLERVFDDSRTDQLHLRGDLRPAANDEVLLELGAMRQGFGEGRPPAPCLVSGFPFICDTNKERTNAFRSGYLHLQWTRMISPDESMRFSLSHDSEYFHDAFLAERFAQVPLPPPLDYHYALVDSGGKSQRQSLEFQHTRRWNEAWRTVWGVEARREAVVSPPLFATSESFSQQQLRLFGNVEWRPAQDWLINAGGMAERGRFGSFDGHWFAPRLAVNYHLTPQHTLRAAATQSFHDPGLYEQRADTRLDVVPLGTLQLVRASGGVRPESLIAQELGYLGRFREFGLTVDLRLYRERMNQRIWRYGVDYVNLPGPTNRGFEYQLDWRPFAATRLLFAQAHQRVIAGRDDNNEALEAPRRVSSLTWLQKLPGNLDFSLMASETLPLRWGGGVLSAVRELDARLGWSFHLGATHGELAFAVQLPGGSGQQYQTDHVFDRRAWTTLRLDF